MPEIAIWEPANARLRAATDPLSKLMTWLFTEVVLKKIFLVLASAGIRGIKV